MHEKEKAKIKVGVASYEAIVKANFEDEDLIDWGTIYACGKQFKMSSVEICELPKQFQQLGFRPTLVYEKSHFVCHKSELNVAHGHRGTQEQMLKIPELFKHPVAIMSPLIGMRCNDENEYNSIEFLCSDNENGQEKFYFMAVNPSDVYNNFIEPKMATRLITFCEISKREFEDRMSWAVNGKRELLMFNQKRYGQLQTIQKKPELEGKASFAKSVNGYYSQRIDTDQKIRFMSNLISKATNNSMRKMCGEKLQNQSYFNQTLESICISLKGSNNMSKIIRMREVLLQAAKQADERYIQTQFKRYVEHTFAKSYIRILNYNKDRALDFAAQKFDEIDLKCNNAEERLYEMADFLESHSMSLESQGIDFSPEAMNNPNVQKAIEISCSFQEELKDVLDVVLNQKLDELDLMIQNGEIEQIDNDEEYDPELK